LAFTETGTVIFPAFSSLRRDSVTFINLYRNIGRNESSIGTFRPGRIRFVYLPANRIIRALGSAAEREYTGNRLEDYTNSGENGRRNGFRYTVVTRKPSENPYPYMASYMFSAH
jgi:hypothetical protein